MAQESSSSRTVHHNHLVLQHVPSLSDTDPAPFTFSTSSSSSSLASSAFFSTASSLDLSADTPQSSSSSPDRASSLPWPESVRRSAARPPPLVLSNSDSSHYGTSNKSHTSSVQFLPRTSSLSALPNIATITTTTTGRRSQSVASTRDAPIDSSSVSPAPDPFSGPSSGTAAPVASIRRKPLTAAAPSPLVTGLPSSFAARSSLSSTSGRIEEEDSAHAALDHVDHLDDDGILEDPLDGYFPTPAQRFTRSWSIDSPTLYEFPEKSIPKTAASSLSKSTRSSAVILDPETREAAGGVPSRNIAADTPAAAQTAPSATSSHHEQDLTATNRESDQIRAPELFESHTAAHAEGDHDAGHCRTNSTMSFFSRKTSPPHLSLGTISNKSENNSNNNNNNNNNNKHSSTGQDSVFSAYAEADENLVVPSATSPNSGNTILGDNSPNTLKPLPKSPGSSRLGTFFGWSSGSPSSTEFSDGAYSPLPSPFPIQIPGTPTATTVNTHASSSTLSAQDISSGSNSEIANKNNNKFKANGAGDNALGYLENLQTPPVAITPPAPSPSSIIAQSSSIQLEEMEDELKAIGAELAASIRREMDLEDLVDRMQAEISNPQAGNKRSSDYFSDSGYSSAKFSDYDAAKEEVAQVQRRAEQEKAQLRLELTEKLSEERTRRTVLDQQVKELSERAASLDVAEMQRRNNEDATGRVKQLEGACEDLRRRLAEERGVKENFEDLVSAIKSELQSATNERDNLRDEVVPQLRARVEGLESQATEIARQAYETTKIQQELQVLKDENSTLRSAAATGATAPSPLPHPPPGNNGSGGGGLSRSNTVKQRDQSAATATTNESRDSLVERLKDVEAQRDALHNALKSLLDRQEFQNRENDKKIRVLEVERERLLAASPKKAGYERDVASLRDEISVLRRRAEDALEQKWQVEKGLGGLKMDLDRAEEEIAGLRDLLKQHDILAPPELAKSRGSSAYGDVDAADAQNVSSESLARAYKDLQASYAASLERIKALEAAGSLPAEATGGDEKTTLALERLEQALASAVAERDAARKDVEVQQSQLAQATESEKALLDSERNLATELEASAARVEELAQQVRSQLSTNAQLRDRLAAMVARGAAEQQANKERITGLEARLRTLEDQLVASQTAAEDRVARHEEQVATLREAHSSQLQRLRDASGHLRVVSTASSRPSSRGGLRSPRTPVSPMFSINGRLVPPANTSRPSSRGGASSTSSDDADQQAQVTTLRARVGELEAALASADQELQEVVGRMNTAQIEVLQLQEDREQAVRDTRRLQRLLEAEQVKSFEDRFRLLSDATVQ